ncbi:MAG: DUF4124 domain-containing protein [Pseudomonas sp.]|nr:DUF4124 domain-containing protein [Pseudomonas sp.]
MRYLLAILAMLPGLASASGIYKCVDTAGRVNFTDTPCGGAAAGSNERIVGGIRPADLFMVEPRYQNDVAKMLNRLSEQHSACRQRIDPNTAGKSSTQGSAGNPSFFVQCGDSQVPEVVRFTMADIQGGATPSAAVAVTERAANRACEQAAKARALIPASVDFSRILDANFVTRPNGISTFTSTLTATNGFGAENRFFISCTFEGPTLADVSVKPFD